MQISPWGRCLVSAPPIPIGEWHNSLYWLTLTKTHKFCSNENHAPNPYQADSHQANPPQKKKFCMYNVLYTFIRIVYEIRSSICHQIFKNALKGGPQNTVPVFTGPDQRSPSSVVFDIDKVARQPVLTQDDMSTF